MAGFVAFGSILIALISRVFFVSMYLRGAAAERRHRATLVGTVTIAAWIATDVLLIATGTVILLANAQIGVLQAVKFVALSLVVTFLVSTIRKAGVRQESRGT